MKAALSREARAVIREALASEGVPGDEHRARLRRSVLARVAAGGAVTLVGSSVAKASASSLLATVASSVALGFGAGVVLFGAGRLAFGPNPPSANPRALPAASAELRRPAPEAASRAEPSRAELILPELSASESSAQQPKLRVRPLRAPQPELAPPSASASAGSPLRAELELLARVQEALRDGRGARALTLIARYDADFPNGLLQTERLAAEVFAACQLGEQARARRVARSFLARDHTSALAVRVEKACASTISSGP